MKANSINQRIKVKIIGEKENEYVTKLKREIESHGLIGEFVEGVFLKSVSEDDSFDISKFEQRYRRLPRIGEIGCSLSHQSIYRRHIENIEWSIVLEDDATLNNFFGEKVKTLFHNYVSSTPTVIILGCSKHLTKNHKQRKLLFPSIAEKLISTVSLFKPYKINKYGTVGYMINASGSKLIREIGNPFNLADDWKLFEEYGLDVWHLKEYIVHENFENKTSSTGNDLIDIHCIENYGLIKFVILVIKNNLIVSLKKYMQ